MLKIKCKHKRQEERNHFYENYYVVEYDIYCSDCGEYLGHWAYGSFDMEYNLNYELKGFKRIKVWVRMWLDNVNYKINKRKIKREIEDINRNLPF